MKKRVVLFAFFASFLTAKAQSYLGYYHDNYAGVQGVLFNPASIVDSRFKTDINLFSISGTAANDAYGVKVLDVLKDNYDFDTQAKQSFSTNNKAIFNLDIMGPSFMFNIAPKHSIAIFTRARNFFNVVDVNGKVINDITKDNSNSFSNAQFGSPNIVGNIWGEVGLSYAAVLMQRGAHFLKGGFTAKYLQGAANGYFQGTGIEIAYNEGGTPATNIFTTKGTALYGTSQDFENDEKIKFDSDSKGFGFDLGLVYEWRPDFDASRADINDHKELNKYKIRVGISVTDLGSIKYNKGVSNGYDLNASFSQDDFDGYENFDGFLKNEFVPTNPGGAYKASLPTAIHADVDWNIHNKFYANLNGDFSAVSKTKLNQNSIANRISLTPRYESKWFSAYVPISYMDYSKQAQVGLGLRTGVFFIGSGSILSNVISNNSRGVDIHAGVKIPVYQKELKDTDGDGVYDKHDKCPDVAGPVENNGCPWTDKDNDTVLDKDDKCPNVAGPVENNGCPWPDTDKDSVLDKDDKCPDVAGPVENKGCPWPDTDGDGVLDKDDKCPKVKGTIANNGCPEIKAEVTAEVIKKLNDYSKAVLFNSGKSTIRPESHAKLDEIVKVMNEFDTAKFRLDGYTDSTGSAAKNLQLSKDRAAAVKNYLIAKGISSDRLSSEGYGIQSPIASNKTVAGRALNRRVEVILVK